MNDAEISQLLLAPSESLGVELKAWLDLKSEDHRARTAKELMALRNHGGGVLLFGFDDKTLKPMTTGRPADVANAYHKDKVQKIVKDFVDPPFEAEVHIFKRNNLDFPAVFVPSGITFPVIARREGNGIRQYGVYVRSVNNAGVVESTEARSAADWEALIRTCFDNREADIARFFRRHLPEIAKQLKTIPEPVNVIGSIFEAGTEAYRTNVRHHRKE